MEEAKLINMSKVQQKKRQEAFEWANEDFESRDFPKESVRILFDDDQFSYTRHGCLPSLFCDRETGKTLFRRDWPSEGIFTYSRVSNLGELCATYSVSWIKHLLSNGIKLHQFYVNHAPYPTL